LLLLNIAGTVLEIIIISFSVLGVVETITYIKKNPTYSFTWIKKASAVILFLTVLAYIYLLVRSLFPMSLLDYYWYSTIVIRILVAGLVIVLALSAKIRNIHRR
jgi:hypothetical protein